VAPDFYLRLAECIGLPSDLQQKRAGAEPDGISPAWNFALFYLQLHQIWCPARGWRCHLALGLPDPGSGYRDCKSAIPSGQVINGSLGIARPLQAYPCHRRSCALEPPPLRMTNLDLAGSSLPDPLVNASPPMESAFLPSSALSSVVPSCDE